MSFSADAKKELIEIWPKRRCCKAAEAYGLLLFARLSSKWPMTLKTDKEKLARRFRSLCKQFSGTEPDICDESGMFTVTLPDFITPPDNFFVCEKCRSAFLRGAFLICGTISDPDKEYHLEFISKTEELAWELCTILKSINLNAKIIERKGAFVTYLKDSENIEDLMTLLGSPNSSLDIMNVKILKDFRNNINRVTNFETANIEKTAKASAKHLEAIRILEEKNLLDSLPKELYETAVARRDNFELSLNELGEMLSLSRSGINHRLCKITELAKEASKQ